MHKAVELHCGTSVCTVFPSLGGSLASWKVGTQNMLRTANPKDIAAGNLLGMASFPLVPYSNRIGYAQFEWNGVSHTIAPNFAPEPHAIHGVGWTQPWTVAAQTANAITLSLHTEDNDQWPWPFRAEQRIVVERDRLTLHLSAFNKADTPVPLAFGHHPYFDSEGATLQFAAAWVWDVGSDALPQQAAAPNGRFDFSRPTPVAGRGVDHCYTGVRGPAKIVWADRPHSLDIIASDNLPAAVVYAPASGNAFCYEPVPHLNNALNMAIVQDSMPIIAPGKSFQSRIDFVLRARQSITPRAEHRTHA
jgi:aldose 1-epimerase